MQRPICGRTKPVRNWRGERQTDPDNARQRCAEKVGKIRLVTPINGNVWLASNGAPARCQRQMRYLEAAKLVLDERHNPRRIHEDAPFLSGKEVRGNWAGRIKTDGQNVSREFRT